MLSTAVRMVNTTNGCGRPNRCRESVLAIATISCHPLRGLKFRSPRASQSGPEESPARFRPLCPRLPPFSSPSCSRWPCRLAAAGAALRKSVLGRLRAQRHEHVAPSLMSPGTSHTHSPARSSRAATPTSCSLISSPPTASNLCNLDSVPVAGGLRSRRSATLFHPLS
jgi:hypothetical protein